MAAYNDYLQYGGNLMIFIASGATKEPIAFSTNAKLSVSMKSRDISSKDSGNWVEKATGKYEWTMTSDSLMNFATTGTTMSVDDLYTYFTSGTLMNVGFGVKSGSTPSWSLNTSSKNWTGTAYITSLEMNAPDGEQATYSVTLEGTGALTMG